MDVELPPDLKFRFQLNKQLLASISMDNPNDKRVAFKIKTTAPKKYVVRPSSGVVEPRSSMAIQVIMQAQKEHPPDFQNCKDKFMVQTTVLADSEQLDKETFNKDLRKDLKEHRLKVARGAGGGGAGGGGSGGRCVADGCRAGAPTPCPVGLDAGPFYSRGRPVHGGTRRRVRRSLVAADRTGVEPSGLCGRAGRTSAGCPFCGRGVEWWPCCPAFSNLAWQPQLHPCLTSRAPCTTNQNAQQVVLEGPAAPPSPVPEANENDDESAHRAAAATAAAAGSDGVEARPRSTASDASAETLALKAQLDKALRDRDDLRRQLDMQQLQSASSKGRSSSQDTAQRSKISIIPIILAAILAFIVGHYLKH